MNTRRQFLITAPPTFGTGPATGPAAASATFAEAEKLARVTMGAGIGLEQAFGVAAERPQGFR